MSWYTNYTLGYISKEDSLIHPLGPFNSKGKLLNIICTSASFTTDLKDSFRPVGEIEVSDDFMKQICYYKEPDNTPKQKILSDNYVGICKLSDLPTGEYIKSNYYLISDVSQYMRDKDDLDLFYDYLTPVEYAERLKIESTIGFHPTLDEEGNPTSRSIAEYMYFSYPDYHCKEYEASILRYAASIYEFEKDVKEVVVIKTEG